MFALDTVDTDSNENEPIGLFDQVILNLKKLKKEIFDLYDGIRFESDDETFDRLIQNIDLTEVVLNDPGDTIDEEFFIDIWNMLLLIQKDFEVIISHQRIMQDALKNIRDRSDSIIDGSDLVRSTLQSDVSRARHIIFRLNTEIKWISNNTTTSSTSPNAKIYNFPHTVSDKISRNKEHDTVHNTNFPKTVENIVDNNNDTSHVIKLDPENRRKNKIQNLAFDSSGKLLPNAIINQKREEIKKALNKEVTPVFNWDCLAANDETFPDNELSDEMILRAIKQAKVRKDGAFIQSIKNNLIRNAANGETLDDGLETSLLLSDHIKNLSETNFIQLQTVEYGKLTIISAKTIEYGDATYYKARIIFADGQIRNLLLSASAFAVWDLSDKIAWEYDANWKLHIDNKPCTMRNIRSRIISNKWDQKGFFKNVWNNIKSWLNKFVNTFKFGKK
jgi:hypothetical protein